MVNVIKYATIRDNLTQTETVYCINHNVYGPKLWTVDQYTINRKKNTHTDRQGAKTYKIHANAEKEFLARIGFAVTTWGTIENYGKELPEDMERKPTYNENL